MSASKDVLRSSRSTHLEGNLMRVAVYTIALNEAGHVRRWAESAADADYRIVVDTGSTDQTVQLLKEAGVVVHSIALKPWRFDDARNTAMALIPSDVDICCTMDMDRWLAPNWRPKLEAAWAPGTTALFCRTVYRASENDSRELRSWPTKNFHSRWNYRFHRPVHEALQYAGQSEVNVTATDIIMYEAQDLTKATRGQYLPLMEVAHRENPNDAQICFWLGREYMYAGQNYQAADALRLYLGLPASTWRDERAEAMRYLARVVPDEKSLWLDRARQEAPHRREIWLDLAEHFHADGDWASLFWSCTNGIKNTHRTGSYLDDESCWGFRLYDLGAIAAWRLDAINLAIDWQKRALEIDSTNQRLQSNLDVFLSRRDEIVRDAAR